MINSNRLTIKWPESRIAMSDQLQSVICGDILKVDLNDHTFTRETIPETLVGRFLGGRGFNVGYLFEHLPTDTDPMSPDNILLFSCGLLTGSRAPTASRLHLNALSPLTGLIGSSNVGGYAGAWLRSTGILSLVIRGCASMPVYLYISDAGVEIRDATPYWGLDTFNTQDRIAADFPSGKLQILSIGTAAKPVHVLPASSPVKTMPPAGPVWVRSWVPNTLRRWSSKKVHSSPSRIGVSSSAVRSKDM